ncbi:XRE family transcriptional regulator [Streptomyces sp. DSM 44915]|uniref:XRE family transcriptional regulator n=1 Tax=Streptomyces chisholmiae TaxID=3075540 RepID=A0ABU2JZR3_9ACTN|nr:XRE family transcriptional regulator [Streptomyces sp. DSM 44915]MDT0270477.1 XRE family transcriptional regulator [Streptomyces sp. DSM 44915]
MTPTARPAEPPGVGARLRELRRHAGLTLEAAARRAELSPAHLSRLETAHRQPSLPALLSLARVYGTTVSGLLGEAAGPTDVVVRADQTPAQEAGGWRYRSAGGPGRAMQALRVHVPPGPGQRELVRVHPGEEWLHVLSGRLLLALGEAEHRLAEGDSAHFDSLTPHRISALSPGGVELLFVHTLLRSADATLCLGDPARRAAPAAVATTEAVANGGGDTHPRSRHGAEDE